jgi:mRNA export factor
MQVVAKHDAPVRSCHFVPALGSGMLVTASWDKTLRYWDLRQATPAHKQNLSERVYSLDVRHPLLVSFQTDQSLRVLLGATFHMAMQLQCSLMRTGRR